jgi:IclR family transcriptional regulator, KDG regulon repressor
VRMSSSIGRRAPAYCTAVGKAILAELPAAEVDVIINRSGLKTITKNTLTTPEALLAELKVIRERGFAIDDEENEVGVRCVGAAVRDYLGRPVAALSVSGPAFRVSKARVLIIAKPVMRAAAALSAELGFKPQVSAMGGAFGR